MNKNSTSGNREILYVIETIAQEKDIPLDRVIDAMQEGMKFAARKKYGADLDIESELDKKTGDLHLYNKKEIVEDGTDDSSDFNNKKQITLSDAKRLVKNGSVEISGNVEVGNVVKIELPNVDLNRVAVQIARNEIIKKIKEAERDKEYNEFIDRVGTIVNGVVKKIGLKNIVVEVDGYEALLNKDGMIPGERFRVGDRVRSYVKEVIKEYKGAQIFLSRTDDMFLAELFRQEVPEIYDGVIEIMAIARDPGSKAKIAIYCRNETSDIIGACVGMRGVRVQAVTSELRGEKIDVIRWSDNPVQFVVNAISPAKPIKVIFDEEKNSAEVVLPKDQLSVAIGRGGQNVKLTSKLTGIRVDVMTEEEEKQRRMTEFKELTTELIEALDIEEVMAQLLITEGFGRVEDIADASLNALARIQGFDENIAQELQERAVEYLGEKEEK